MIHPRRGSGTLHYRLAFALFGLCLVVAVSAIVSGQAGVAFQVPWKGIATLAVLAAAALVVRLRRGRAG